MKITLQKIAWLLLIVFYSHKSFAGATDSVFKSWYYTPSGVFGRIALVDTRERAFCQISRKDANSVLVREYNPAGILVKTSGIHFKNGKLSLITETNQWGENYDSVFFKSSDVDEFIVTEKLRGQNPNLPCLALRYTFRKNLLIEILCLKDSTKPVKDRDGIAHYIFERYDDQQRFGLLKSESFYDEIDNAVISGKKEGHKIRYEYDNRANLIGKSIFDTHDEPIATRLGNFKTRSQFDKWDNETQIDYYDKRSAMEGQHQPRARLVKEYKNGFLSKEKHLNEDYTSSVNKYYLDSATTIEYSYDKKGNLIEKTYYDENGLAINNNRGIFKTSLKYNDLGMLTGLAFFNSKSIPVADEWGNHRYLFARSPIGQKTSEKTFDNLDAPAINIEQDVFETKYKYDNWGRIISISYWSNDTSKATSRSGYHESISTYDQNGLLVSVDYLDKNSRNDDNKFGFSNQKITYDDRFQKAEIKFFHGENPVLLKDPNFLVFNFHRIKYNYDFYNRVRSLEYFDDLGNPANAIFNFWDLKKSVNAHRVEFEYDGFNLLTEKFYSRIETDTVIVLDCKKQNSLAENGLVLNRHGYVPKEVSLIRDKFRGVKLDSFFAKQIAFISRDTVLLLLDRNTYKLAENVCAGIYRLAPINKYFQFNGLVTDYFFDNDLPASQLNYVEGYLDGLCTFYYKNGNIRERGEYRKNKRIGIWDYYYESGIKSKSIKFTESAKYLVESFDGTGKPEVVNGNGIYTSPVFAIEGVRPQVVMKGKIKDGFMEGEWKVSTNEDAKVILTEKFSKGQFVRGLSEIIFLRSRDYFSDPFCKIDFVHPEENMDHYKQNEFCEVFGDKILRQDFSYLNLRQEKLEKIESGIQEVLRSNSYSDYSGWVLLDIKCDENGNVISKSAKMYQPNSRLQDDLLLTLFDFESPRPLIKNNKIPFELFYIFLIESNKMAVPERFFK